MKLASDAMASAHAVSTAWARCVCKEIWGRCGGGCGRCRADIGPGREHRMGALRLVGVIGLRLGLAIRVRGRVRGRVRAS